MDIVKPVLLFILLLALSPAFARATHASGSHGGSHTSRSASHLSGSQASTKVPSSSRASPSGSHAKATHSKSGKAVAGIKRDSHGKIARSQKAKDQFKKSHPCPSSGKSSGACPGYVIDHVQALKRGGADAPSNMQWQTKEAAKAKDKWE